MPGDVAAEANGAVATEAKIIVSTPSFLNNFIVVFPFLQHVIILYILIQDYHKWIRKDMTTTLPGAQNILRLHA